MTAKDMTRRVDVHNNMSKCPSSIGLPIEEGYMVRMHEEEECTNSKPKCYSCGEPIGTLGCISCGIGPQ